MIIVYEPVVHLPISMLRNRRHQTPIYHGCQLPVVLITTVALVLNRHSSSPAYRCVC